MHFVNIIKIYNKWIQSILFRKQTQ